MGPKRLLYPEEAMQAALQSVKEGKKSLREAARLHHVPHTTLQGRLRGRPSMRKLQRTVLSSDKEGRIVTWLEESARRGFGRSKSQILNTVQTMLRDTEDVTPFKDGRPGNKWYKGFMKRHHERLSIRTPQALGAQRASVTPEKTKGRLNQPPATTVSLPTASPHLPSSSGTSSAAPCTSSSTSVHDLSPLTALDRLIDVTARVGLDRVVQFRTLHALKRHTEDPDQQLFNLLYDILRCRLRDTDNISSPTVT